MGKFIKTENRKDALKNVVARIDSKKFDIELTEGILKKNGWLECSYDMTGNAVDGWAPEALPQVYDEATGEWAEQDVDFDDCFVWYRAMKGAWCYKYTFGTYVYDIKSVGELELILAREGFDYEFEV